MTITDEKAHICCYGIFPVPSASGLPMQSSPNPYLSGFLSPLHQFSNVKDIKYTKRSGKNGIFLNTTNWYSQQEVCLRLCGCLTSGKIFFSGYSILPNLPHHPSHVSPVLLQTQPPHQTPCFHSDWRQPNSYTAAVGQRKWGSGRALIQCHPSTLRAAVRGLTGLS